MTTARSILDFFYKGTNIDNKLLILLSKLLYIVDFPTTFKQLLCSCSLFLQLSIGGVRIL